MIKGSKASRLIRSKDGTLLTKSSNQLHRFEELFTEILNSSNTETPDKVVPQTV